MSLRLVLSFASLALATMNACDEGAVPRNEGRPRTRAEARSYGPATELGRIRIPEVTEASGIVASRRHAESYWVHNDSGGLPHLYCVQSDGSSCGTLEVAGAEMIDWEDIAIGPDGDLYIGDIGNNNRERTTVVVYRVPEPGSLDEGATQVSDPATTIELTWPRRPFDAETLLVDPTSGALYVVTKGSPALVFRAAPDGGRLRPVAALELPGLLSFPTGGDVAPNGRHVVLTTYDRAFEFSMAPGSPLSSIWRREERSISLPLARQREAIAYGADGEAIVVTSEGPRAPLVERSLVR